MKMVKKLLKWAPIIYPIVKKILHKRKTNHMKSRI
ncbi:MAG TPA: hypothetical protein VEY70_01165 [Metabacillus sp.]|nr:hypothetical protein [Metabacillus sp.]